MTRNYQSLQYNTVK